MSTTTQKLEDLVGGLTVETRCAEHCWGLNTQTKRWETNVRETLAKHPGIASLACTASELQSLNETDAEATPRQVEMSAEERYSNPRTVVFQNFTFIIKSREGRIPSKVSPNKLLACN